MRKILNKVISKIKDEPYEIDKDIPLSCLIGVLVSKMIQLIRGLFVRIHFKKKNKGKHIFVGKKVKIICKKKISLGRGITISDYCYINALSKNGIKIGNNVSIGRNSIIECTGVLRELGESLIIEDGVGIGPNAFIAVRGNIKIGKNTIFGPNVKIHSESHIYADKNTPIRLQGTKRLGVEIGEDCWIGENVTILDGVKIGKGCIIGAGAIVNRNCEDYGIYAGVPAKIINIR